MPTKVYELSLHSSCRIQTDSIQIVAHRVVTTNKTITISDADMMPRGKVNSTADSKRSFTWLYRTGDALIVPVWISSPGRYAIDVTASTYGNGNTQLNLYDGKWLQSTVEIRGQAWQQISTTLDFNTPGQHELIFEYANDAPKLDLLIDQISISATSEKLDQSNQTIDASQFKAGYGDSPKIDLG